ncbi:MAG: pyridoxal phosphate-dependent aminotransferase [Oligoflexus sp.]
MVQNLNSNDMGFRNVPRTGVIFVMSRAQAKGFTYGDPDWSNLGQGAPETGPIDGEGERLKSIVVDPRMSEYSPVAGDRDLRQSVADLYNYRYRRGMASQYTYENVAISAGGRVGLSRLAAALGGINLGHFLPDYTAYEELFEIFKAFVPIPIVLEQSSGFHLGADLLRTEVVNRGLGGVLLSNPANPTGQVLWGDELQKFVGVGREMGCCLIFDEFYSHYVYVDPGKVYSSSAAAYVENVNQDPIVLIDGLTKNWRYPGLRLSWTVGPKSIIEKVSSAGSFLDGGAAHPIQKAAIPLLDPDYADGQAKTIQNAFLTKRKIMTERLLQMGFEIPGKPQGGFYCFVSLAKLPESLQDGMSFFERSIEEKVICVPGEFFDVNPGKRRSHIPSRLKGFVRFSFGPSMEEMCLGLDRLENMLAAHQPKRISR